MTAHNFNLRGIPDPVFSLLKKESAKQKISINTFIERLAWRTATHSTTNT